MVVCVLVGFRDIYRGCLLGVVWLLGVWFNNIILMIVFKF